MLDVRDQALLNLTEAYGHAQDDLVEIRDERDRAQDDLRQAQVALSRSQKGHRAAWRYAGQLQARRPRGWLR